MYQELRKRLKEMSWKDDKTMLDFYEMYYVPFGELLTDMERSVQKRIITPRLSVCLSLSLSVYTKT